MWFSLMFVHYLCQWKYSIKMAIRAEPILIICIRPFIYVVLLYCTLCTLSNYWIVGEVDVITLSQTKFPGIHFFLILEETICDATNKIEVVTFLDSEFFLCVVFQNF